VEATARREIDSDGPGFYFSLEPGGASGKTFMDAFSTAQGMRISRDGKNVDTLPLAGSEGAMSALARCLAERWSKAMTPPRPRMRRPPDRPACRSSRERRPAR
jgi:hypothetical protein